MHKLFLSLLLPCMLHSMQNFLLSAFPAAMSGLVGYSAGRQHHMQEAEKNSAAFNKLLTEHEHLKSHLTKSGLLIRGTHQVVLCNPLNTLFNRSIEHRDEQGMHTILHHVRDLFDINGLDQNGRTALHVATLQKNEPCMKFLRLNGANPDTLDVFGMAPMHYAAHANDIETMTLLSAFGANLNIKRPEDGLTPLTAALKANKQEAIAFLLALKHQRAEMEREPSDKTERAPSPDHRVTLLGSLRVALEMQKRANQEACGSLNLIFHAFLERNPECPICFEEMPTDIRITPCCQRGVCATCETGLSKQPACPFCRSPFNNEPFLIYQRSSPPRPASRNAQAPASSCDG